jgi:D-amino-acid N-acetyltransferase
MSIEVRDIVESDYEEWNRLFDLYLTFYESSLTQEVKDITFKRLLDPNVDMWCAIAVHPETKKPIGIAQYLKHLNTWKPTDKIYLNDLYVDENERLKHVGRSLIEYVYNKADEMNAPDVYWVTSNNNHRAQLLYTKVGYNAGKATYKRTGY